MSVYEPNMNRTTDVISTGDFSTQKDQPLRTSFGQPSFDRAKQNVEGQGPYRRRRWTPEEKKSIVAETELDGASISGVARKHGIAPRLLFSWRRQLCQELALTQRSGPKIAPIQVVKDLEKRVQELEDLLAKKSVEIGTLTRELESTRG